MCCKNMEEVKKRNEIDFFVLAVPLELALQLLFIICICMVLAVRS